MSDIGDAIENAASADNGSQFDHQRKGFSTVSDHRIATAREIIRRFLEYVDSDLTVAELRDAIEDERR